MYQHELDKDLPDYLVFMILNHVRELREISPNHIIVKILKDTLEKAEPDMSE